MAGEYSRIDVSLNKARFYNQQCGKIPIIETLPEIPRKFRLGNATLPLPFGMELKPELLHGQCLSQNTAAEPRYIPPFHVTRGRRFK